MGDVGTKRSTFLFNLGASTASNRIQELSCLQFVSFHAAVIFLSAFSLFFPAITCFSLIT